ncbi:MAG: response regulator transcription factor [Syntrophales bacterium]|nr:response regulator transcription factor [Syntrophales bacterium]
MNTKILLADDHQIMREGLVALLEREPGLQVVGQAEDGRAAVQLARKVNPDVVVMDVSMPDLNGIDATRQILEENAQIKVIALSMHADRRFVKGMLQAGASGYLLKHSASQELIKAIKVVMANRVYLSPEVAGVVVEDYKAPAPDTSAFAVLTPREREVLQLFAEGKTTRQIAATLHLGLKTVEAYRRQIMEKLGCQSLAELIKYALREGLTSLDA